MDVEDFFGELSLTFHNCVIVPLVRISMFVPLALLAWLLAGSAVAAVAGALAALCLILLADLLREDEAGMRRLLTFWIAEPMLSLTPLAAMLAACGWIGHENSHTFLGLLTGASFGMLACWCLFVADLEYVPSGTYDHVP